MIKLPLRSLEHHGIKIKLVYSSKNISDNLNFLLCASDFIIPWCLTHRITGAPPTLSVAFIALKIALRSFEHHGIKMKLVALNSKVIALKKN